MDAYHIIVRITALLEAKFEGLNEWVHLCFFSYFSLWFGILKTRGIVRGKIGADYWSVASFDNFKCLLVIMVVPDISIGVLYILLKVINIQPCVQVTKYHERLVEYMIIAQCNCTVYQCN